MGSQSNEKERKLIMEILNYLDYGDRLRSFARLDIGGNSAYNKMTK